MEAFLAFLVEHGDLITFIWKAIQGGLTKASIMDAVKQAQIAATEAAVAADLGARP